MTTNDSLIALPGVGISGAQTSPAGLVFSLEENPLPIDILRQGLCYCRYYMTCCIQEDRGVYALISLHFSIVHIENVSI